MLRKAMSLQSQRQLCILPDIRPPPSVALNAWTGTTTAPTDTRRQPAAPAHMNAAQKALWDKAIKHWELQQKQANRN